VSSAEKDLLRWMLARFPSARSVLEVGCGTAHFTRWLEPQRLVVGLERSAAMLREARRLRTEGPLVHADATRLPFPDRSFDLVLLVTVLESIDESATALRDAVRVARGGLCLIVLNPWSAGGFSRRWGPQARKPLLGQARDNSLGELRAGLSRAAGVRLVGVVARSSVYPRRLCSLRTRIPLGDVLGVSARLC
jgi:ubiquinone/menaquinone biosynthesis C-methylase UbiE